MKKLLIILFALFTVPVNAQWNAAKPAEGPGPADSSDIRDNWDALARTVGAVNLMADPTFLMWPAGDAAAPSYYILAGTGGTIARTGTGLGDTNRKVGDFAVKVISGASNAATLTQTLLPTAAFTKASFLQGLNVSAGAWLRTSSASAVRICLDDAVAQSCSSFAPGNSTWTWVTATRTLNASATKLSLYLEVASGTITGYYSGPTVVLGSVPPSYYQPGRTSYRHCLIFRESSQTTGTDKNRCLFERPAIIKDVQMNIKTAPQGAAFIIDINTWDGVAFTSMFTSGGRPQIAAAAFAGGARPDTTYARRAVLGSFDASLGNGTIVTMDIDQVGSTTAGADLYVMIRYLTYDRPLEEFLAYNDVN